jgi:DNA replication licensing factor MCM3
MEQQTVTISKGGIHASLNARCSVVAAANPVYGQYDTERSPMANIGLPDSLLSRFDLLFVILDTKDSDSDRRISKHVLRMHSLRRTTPPSAMVGMGAPEAGPAAAKSTPMWVRMDASMVGDDESTELLSVDFIKKYIQYAKRVVQPVMSDDAATKISRSYAELRNEVKDSVGRTLPVTARTLETLIRLSSAHAKLHLKSVVEEEDADFAVRLLYYALFKNEVQPKQDGDGDYDSGPGGDDDGAPPPHSAKRAATEDASDASASQRPRLEVPRSKLIDAILSLLPDLLAADDGECSAETLLAALRGADAAFAPLGREELDGVLEAMEESDTDGDQSGKFMYRDGILHGI